MNNNRLTILFLLLCLVSCGKSKAIRWEVTPSKAFLERKAAYLAYCASRTASGGYHGQTCAAYKGSGLFNETAIRGKLNDKINPRKDTADFDMNTILRVLFLDRKNPSLPAALRTDMEKAVLDFKYWLDEPGPDTMCWWSENHQILFHTAEYTAGLLFPDRVFSNSGMTGRQHVEHARPRIHRWLDFRGRFGFSEWHSNVYFQEDIPPLITLVDVADEVTVRTKAAMVLDMMAFDMLSNFYKGLFATTHGRTYPSKLLGGLNDSIRAWAYLVTGLGKPADITELGSGDFSASYLATSDKYVPPAIFDTLAQDSRDNLEHRQRDSISLDDGPRLGLTYTRYDDVMFWWGMTAYAAPEVIQGSFAMVDNYNMWEGFFWENLSIFKSLVGDPYLDEFATENAPVTRGVVLESVNTYTYRTPHYQLSAAQDWKPGSITGQVLIWLATIDKDAYIFTSFPTNSGESILGEGFLGSLWTGGFSPRATIYKNVGVIQYRMPALTDTFMGLFGQDLLGYNHAYFPKTRFDRVVESNNWTIGKKGDSYAALYSKVAPAWSTTEDYDLVASATENVWIIEMGDAAHNGSFDEFVSAITSANLQITDAVHYESPSVGTVEVGWTGPMKVAGQPVDLGPYRRWDNRYCQQEFDTPITEINIKGNRLELDFLTPSRTYVSVQEGTGP